LGTTELELKEPNSKRTINLYQIFQVRCIYTRQTCVYYLIAKDHEQKRLLHATQQLTEPKLLGEVRCQPHAATAR